MGNYKLLKVSLLVLLSTGFVMCSSFSKDPVAVVEFQQYEQKRKIATTGEKIFHEKSGYLFDPNDTSCDGFPMVQVETLPGTCLGMVLHREAALDEETDRSFIKPRTIVQIPQTDQFLLIDMGGWKPNNGRLFLLSRRNPLGETPKDNNYSKNPYDIKLIKFGLDTPHGLALGFENYFYVGEKDKISRFKYSEGQLTDWQTVVTGLPAFDGHMHPLTQFTFDPKTEDLIINSGAPSDHCFVSDLEGGGDYKTCPESDSDGMGAIYRIPNAELYSLPIKGVKSEWVIGKGLRNSMAMAVHRSGYLLQGENSRDFPEFEEPYEELNVIDLNHTSNNDGQVFHYGWPYCYDFRGTSPEWNFEEANNYGLIRERFKKPIDCRASLVGGDQVYKAPHSLMPPHVAPLHMAYYTSNMAQSPKGLLQASKHLIVSWHGHQPTGNRLVAYPHDNSGLPILETHGEPTYNVDSPGSCPKKNKFNPHMGMLRHAPYIELISGWSKIEGVRPEGAPVGFSLAEDGSIWIVEDRENRSVVRLAKTSGPSHKDNCSLSKEEFTDPNIELLVWRDHLKNDQKQKERYFAIQDQLIKVSCTGCHGDYKNNDIDESRYNLLDFIVKNEWVHPNNLESSKLYGAVAHLDSFTPMPPADKPQIRGTEAGERVITLVKDWIEAMPKRLGKGFKKVKVVAQGNRRIRDKNTLEGSKVCGHVSEGDLIYIDSNPKSEADKDGYHWVKLYLLPNSTRVNKDSCETPINGEYFLAVGKTGEANLVFKNID